MNTLKQLMTIIACLLFSNDILLSQSGNAISLDGIDDYLSIQNPEIINLTDNDLTITMWTNVSNKNCVLLSKKGKQNGYELLISDDRYGFSLENNEINIHETSSFDKDNADDWKHVAFVYNGKKKTVKYFVNGVLRQEKEFAAGDFDNNSELFIGCSSDKDHFAGGLFDEVRVYGIDFNLDNVHKDMYTKVDAHTQSLIAAWDFDDGISNGIVSDIKGKYSASIHGDPLVHTAVFQGGDASSISYRIPALITCSDGTLLAAIDKRATKESDINDNYINITLRRSTDNGKTWGPIINATNFLTYGKDQGSASDCSMVLDESSDRVFMFYNYMVDVDDDIYRFHVITSDDSGLTWSKATDITDQVVATAPADENWGDDAFKFIVSGRGIYTSKGEIMVAALNTKIGARTIYSNDNGKTWSFKGALITPTDECKLIELADGGIMVNSRSRIGKRIVHRATGIDLSEWITVEDDNLPAGHGANGSIIRYSKKGDEIASTGKIADKDRILFSNPSFISGRSNIKVRLSYDEGYSWGYEKLIKLGYGAYSSMTVLQDGSIGMLYEADWGYYKGYSQQYSNDVRFVRFTVDWITGGDDSIN